LCGAEDIAQAVDERRREHIGAVGTVEAGEDGISLRPGSCYRYKQEYEYFTIALRAKDCSSDFSVEELRLVRAKRGRGDDKMTLRKPGFR
jgi:hypothetical protein